MQPEFTVSLEFFGTRDDKLRNGDLMWRGLQICPRVIIANNFSTGPFPTGREQHDVAAISLLLNSRTYTRHGYYSRSEMLYESGGKQRSRDRAHSRRACANNTI